MPSRAHRLTLLEIVVLESKGADPIESTCCRRAQTTWVFDPASNDSCGMRAPTLNHCGETIDRGWRRRTTGNSAYERWYPTCTILGSGKVVVTSGGSCQNVTAEIPEVYDRLASSNAFLTLGSSASTTRYPSFGCSR